ncbi:helix-turn-helix transcriptional regulator [Asticcacaulis sp.]|uniref:helix-turn-helix domain-containing protein n=1 Tax=Asticcacaulis sp. TaxID=1872648 RepID=UPI002CBD2806|nr:helix-turn-helix transcriptional regulator [Asticcacaulis sp.]HTM82206.1 helix-turn-helix transcriptional regulator [Asticcacaulis sp.]
MTEGSKQPEPVDVHVGMAIRRRRRSIGMSQGTLAEEMGVTPQQVQKYETAASRISASKVFQAGRALKVPVSYFFAEIDDQELQDFSAEIEANVSAFLKTSDGQELATIFPQIEDTTVRKQFLGLARAMANASQAGKPAQT